MGQLRVENNQLRQLNKYLEVCGGGGGVSGGAVGRLGGERRGYIWVVQARN